MFFIPLPLQRYVTKDPSHEIQLRLSPVVFTTGSTSRFRTLSFFGLGAGAIVS